MDTNKPATHEQQLKYMARRIPELVAQDSESALLKQAADIASAALGQTCAVFTLENGGLRPLHICSPAGSSPETLWKDLGFDAAIVSAQSPGIEPWAAAIAQRSAVFVFDLAALALADEAHGRAWAGPAHAQSGALKRRVPLMAAPVFAGDETAALLCVSGAELCEDNLPLLDNLARIAEALLARLLLAADPAGSATLLFRRMAGDFVHDLNNLLAVIIGNAQLALSGLGDHESREEVQEILEAGRRARAMSDALRAATRGPSQTAERSQTAHEPEAPCAQHGKGRTVLIIDDERALVRLAEKMLAREGYAVLAAESGARGLEIFRERHAQVHAVILDMIMPGMDGEAVFYALKEIDPGVPVILASGFSREGRVSGILDNGARAFVQKPFSASELSQALRGALET